MKGCKLLTILLGVIITILFSACGQSPKGNEITSAGGTIDLPEKGIVITIPEDATDKAIDLVVTEVEQDDRTEEQVSELYELNGIENVIKDIEISLTVKKPLEGETFMAVTLPVYVKSQNKTIEMVEFLDTTVNGNQVSAILPLSQLQKSTEQSSLWDYILGVSFADSSKPTIKVSVHSKMKLVDKNEKFKYKAYSKVTDAQVEMVRKLCNEAHQKITQELGFTKWDKVNRPLDVVIRPPLGIELFSDYLVGASAGAGYFYRYGSVRVLIVNSELFNEPDAIRKTIYHEVFHYAQSLYNEDVWLNEATAVWFEDIVNPQKAPQQYAKNGLIDMQILDGPTNPKGRDIDDLGYGSAGYFKYLTDKMGKGIILTTFNSGKSNDPVGILNGIAPIKDWIHDFYVKTLMSEVYSNGQMTLSTLRMTAPSHTIEVKTNPNPDVDTHLPYDVTIPPYGAHVLNIKLDHEDPDKVRNNIKFAANVGNDQARISLMAYKKGSRLLGTSNDEVSIGELDKLVENKEFVTLLITNESASEMTTDIQFFVDAVPPIDELIGKWTDLTVKVDDVYIHPKLEALLNADIQSDRTASEDDPFSEFGEQCDEAMIEAIKGFILTFKEMEGNTYPATFDISKLTEQSGMILSSMDIGEGFSPMGESVQFAYDEKGVLTVNTSAKVDGEQYGIMYELQFKYEDDKIKVNGQNQFTIVNQGMEIIRLNMTYDGSLPIPTSQATTQPSP